MLAQIPDLSGGQELGSILEADATEVARRDEEDRKDNSSAMSSEPIVIIDTDSDTESDVKGDNARKRKCPRGFGAIVKEEVEFSVSDEATHSDRKYRRTNCGTAVCSNHSTDIQSSVASLNAEQDHEPEDLRITTKMKCLRFLQKQIDMLRDEPKFPQAVTTLNGRTIRFLIRAKERVVLMTHENGVVCAGYASFDDQPEVRVAIKIFHNVVQFAQIYREASLLLQAARRRAPVARCYGLVPLRAAADCRYHEAALVMELIADETSFHVTTLSELLADNVIKDNDNLAMPKAVKTLDWLQLLGDLAYAVGTINGNGVIMNGLKEDSVLVRRDKAGYWKPYIVDFHMARITNDYLGMEAKYDLVDWETAFSHMAPELFECRVLSSWHQDSYSLGILLQHVGNALDMGRLMHLATRCYRITPAGPQRQVLNKGPRTATLEDIE